MICRALTPASRFVVLLAAVIACTLRAQATEIEVFGAGSTTSYLANAVDPGLGTSWTAPGFVEGAGWTAGVFGLGYETEPAPGGAHGLIATAVSPATRSIYTRTTFELADAGAVRSVGLDADFDDGIVAWLNGVEIYRSPGLRWFGEPGWDAVPTESHESSNAASPDYIERDVTAAALGALVDGTNVLALGVWNREPDDLVLVPRLVFDRPLLRGPYLQQGTAHSVVVRWRTAAPAVSRVRYGTDATALEHVAQASVATVEHEVALEGLAPSTRYYYTIGSAAGDVLAGGAGELAFETPSVAGVPRPTRLWVVGDSGWGNGEAEAVREAYRAWSGEGHTALWLMLGDNAYPYGSEQNYQENLFEIYPELLARSVLWPTIGNHDGIERGDWPYLELFTLPEAGEAGGVASGTEQYYAFDWANAHVVVLDSVFSDRSPGSPMWSWLEADLAATSQEWIFAFWHHPPYSKGGHDSDVDLESIQMREHALPLLESYGVDLVLTGHSHSYERSMLIDGHYGDTTTFDPSLLIDAGDGAPTGDGAYQAAGPGTVYAVAGSSSHITPGSAIDLGGTGPNHPVMQLSLLEVGSMVLELDGNRLDGWFLDASGDERDRFTLIKGAAPEAPVADFEASPLVVGIGETVSFTDSSTHAPTWWGWDFDGNGVVDDQQPSATHAYALVGAYTVELAVSNSAGADAELRTDHVCVTGGTPGPFEGLTLGPAKSLVRWPAHPLATRYDAIRGDLMALHASGSLVGTGLACSASTSTPEWIDAAEPAPGQGWYYLARGVNCVPETGTYDSLSPMLVASRDAALQGAGAVCACPAADDGDADGYCSGVDNCPTLASAVLADADADGAGDPCDLCTLDPADDADADGHCANADNCPATPNTSQLDFDADGAGDTCDDDDDDDGMPDFFDWFPLDPSLCNDYDDDDCDDCSSGTNAPGNDGVDTDADGWCDAGDGCTDVDGDGFGTGTLDNVGCAGSGTDLDDADPDTCSDADDDGCHDCDGGSWNPAADGPDLDADGMCDAGDNCLATPNPPQADLDLDGLGNPCDPCTDTDHDGFGNPAFPNLCFIDNCPDIPNPTQHNADGDGNGDACDACPADNPDDIDVDFICTSLDNCPTVNNPLQLDLDLDGIGNTCDIDDDDDSFDDAQDCLPLGAGVAAAPGPIGDTLEAWRNGPTTLMRWQPALEGHVSNVYASTQAAGQALAPFTCLSAETPAPFVSHAPIPAPGSLIHFFVSARNSCGESAADLGAENVAEVCPTLGRDTDLDGIADLADTCPLLAGPTTDPDHDFVGSACDNCPAAFNPGQGDADTDGSGDACDD